MKKEFEKFFGCKVETKEYKENLPLPIFMTMRKIEIVSMYDSCFALVDISRERDLSISAMRKQRVQYEEVLKMPVAYIVEITSVGMRNAMVNNGISFVDFPGNVFLPFLGVFLQDVYRKQSVKADKMMPATQMVFLELLYKTNGEGFLKSEVAARLNLTKTSITRATAQLESMGLILQNKSGKEVTIVRNYSRKEYYEKAREYLINPVQKVMEVEWEDRLLEAYKAGESALSLDSSLNPPRIEEYSIYKGAELVDQLVKVDIRFENQEKCIKLQLWKYDPTYFARNGKVDPVSLACSLKDAKDERIEMCIDELLEDL